ncbi:MAG: ECF transporter S component [Candidatus Asgardarchaeia archaeon]
MEGRIRIEKNSTFKIANVSIMSALAVVSGYALSMVPNVELMSFIVFTSGFLMGVWEGVAVALISTLIYTMWNPWGPPLLPISLAQVVCEIVIGFSGGIYGKRKDKRNDSIMVLETTILGAALTIFYDTLTNVAFAIAFDLVDEIVYVLLTGIWYSSLHTFSNAIIFGTLTLPVYKAFKNLKT